MLDNEPLAEPSASTVGGPPQHTAAHWTFPRRPKFAGVGVVRTVPPRETIRRVAPLMGAIGVTRVGEITHLDRNGIPNFIAARPRDLGRGISYYNGKGATRAQARAGAMMEAVERYSGEACGLPVLLESFEKLTRRAPALDPAQLFSAGMGAYRPDLPIEWVRGFDLLAMRPTCVPLNAVVCPYRPAIAPAISYASTNGLASGNTRDEALCHALCEVNERDATSLYYAATSLRVEVDAVLAGLGAAPADRADPHLDYPMIAHSGLPPRAARLLRRLTGAGLRVYLRDITSETGIPAVDCVVAEPRPGGRFVAHGGYGSHPDARVALTRALTEAAQSRLSMIQGGREDLPEVAVAKPPVERPDEAFGRGPVVPFDAVASYPHQSLVEDVDWLVSRFRASGFPMVVALDLTRPELGVPVVRVVAPLAETWTAFHVHFARGALGPRALKKITGPVGGRG